MKKSNLPASHGNEKGEYRFYVSSQTFILILNFHAHHAFVIECKGNISKDYLHNLELPISDLFLQMTINFNIVRIKEFQRIINTQLDTLKLIDAPPIPDNLTSEEIPDDSSFLSSSEDTPSPKITPKNGTLDLQSMDINALKAYAETLGIKAGSYRKKENLIEKIKSLSK